MVSASYTVPVYEAPRSRVLRVVTYGTDMGNLMADDIMFSLIRLPPGSRNTKEGLLAAFSDRALHQGESEYFEWYSCLPMLCGATMFQWMLKIGSRLHWYRQQGSTVQQPGEPAEKEPDSHLLSYWLSQQPGESARYEPGSPPPCCPTTILFVPGFLPPPPHQGTSGADPRCLLGGTQTQSFFVEVLRGTWCVPCHRWMLFPGSPRLPPLPHQGVSG